MFSVRHLGRNDPGPKSTIRCAIKTVNISHEYETLNTYILTYRNNLSFISMVILNFRSVRSNTDQVLIKNNYMEGSGSVTII